MLAAVGGADNEQADKLGRPGVIFIEDVHGISIADGYHWIARGIAGYEKLWCRKRCAAVTGYSKSEAPVVRPGNEQ